MKFLFPRKVTVHRIKVWTVWWGALLPSTDVFGKGAEVTEIVRMTVGTPTAVYVSGGRAGLASRLKIIVRLLGFHPAQVKSV